MEFAAHVWLRGGGDPLALLRLDDDDFAVAVAVVERAGQILRRHEEA